MYQIGFDADLIQSITAGITRSFVVGYCEYTDVFYPETPIHISDFCFEVGFLWPLDVLGLRDVPADYFQFADHPNYAIKIKT
ncbi:hypothetical protein JP75_22945 [Devosia riboflavina]|uniref:Uncharacterized protein n=2 Tax=Devosia riboflavina TaxID=46914 RepID=A0A087LWU0_9HYPH|nr:hypothetical protein JP75_22945 [Devosia riboflavina]